MTVTLNGPAVGQSPVSGGSKDASGVVVILGSSGAAGLGSSGYTTDPGLGGTVSATCWAGLWQAELEAQGYVVKNASKSGTGSQASIDRFETDVAVYNPTHVVICTNPVNDNFNAGPISSSRQYVQNCLKLARMTKNIGAEPILGLGIYPNSSWTATHLACARWMVEQFEQSGYTTCHHIDSLLDTSTSALLAGFASDGLHLQDAGQAAQFAAIPPTLIQAAGLSAYREKISYTKRAILGAETTYPPLTCLLSRASESWTLALRLHGGSAVGASKAFAYVRDATNASQTRIRNPASVYELADAGGARATSAINPTSDGTPHLLVIVKQHRTGLMRMYIDGVQVGSDITSFSAAAVAATGFDVLGRGDSPSSNAVAAGVSAVGFWRTPLAPDVIAKMQDGVWPVSNAEVISDDITAPPICAIKNRARSLEQMACTTALFTASASAPDTAYVEATGAVSQVIGAAAFTTLDLSPVVQTGGRWDAVNKGWVVPVSGRYLCTGSLRVADGSTINSQFGLGVHSATADGNHFLWHTVVDTRTTYPYARIARFAAGDVVRMFTFADAGITTLFGGMQVEMLSAD